MPGAAVMDEDDWEYVADSRDSSTQSVSSRGQNVPPKNSSPRDHTSTAQQDRRPNGENGKGIGSEAREMGLELWPGEEEGVRDRYTGVRVRSLCAFGTPHTFVGGSDCVLLLTPYRLAMACKQDATATYIPVMMISRILYGQPQQDECRVIVTAKNLRTFVCDFSTRSTASMCAYHLLQLCRPRPTRDYFTVHTMLKRGAKGYSYDYERDMARVGLLSQDESGLFRLCSVNQDYRLCPTYPRQLVVPATIGPEHLRASAEFRTRRRVPVVVWRHAGSGAVLARSSQPKTGAVKLLQNTRNSLDEAVISALRLAAPTQRLCIVDARPFANAGANCITGGGYETEEAYAGCTVEFMGLANIHVVRESHIRLRAVCQEGQSERKDWLSALERTGWLEHLSNILASSVAVARKLLDGVAVLVHCSDGWDRTPQLLSLAQLMLDPQYRTLRGFLDLIEKEWLLYGHCFATRSGHKDGLTATDQEREQSPVFAQWLDCVHQLAQMFPNALEFNEVLLCFLGEHVYSCLFAEFICNTQREREQHYTLRPSLFTYITQHSSLFTNLAYRPHPGPMLPQSTAVRCMTFWKGLHLSEFREGDYGQLLDLYRTLRQADREAQERANRETLRAYFSAWRTHTAMARQRREEVHELCLQILESSILAPVYQHIEDTSYQMVGPTDGRPDKSNGEHARWVPDDAVARCCLCSVQFGMLRRRHHCRNCGNVVCGGCSAQRSTIPHTAYHSVLVRVCSPCFAILNPIAHKTLNDIGQKKVEGPSESEDSEGEGKPIFGAAEEGVVDGLLLL